jgi:hypothetical protein
MNEATKLAANPDVIGGPWSGARRYEVEVMPSVVDMRRSLPVWADNERDAVRRAERSGYRAYRATTNQPT